MARTEIYRHTASYAMEHNELDLFHESERANRNCAKAIETAVRDSMYELYYYDLETAAKNVIHEHGAERVQYVLARIVNQSEWDGRYSQNNKEWAKGFDLPSSRNAIVINTHPTLIDGFVNHVRKAVLQSKLRLAQTEDTRGEYKYYSLRRPIDIGTIPRKPKPVSVTNYNSRIFVEDHSFSAWGSITYSEPLTDKQVSDYELRAASTNPRDRVSMLDNLQKGKERSGKAAKDKRPAPSPEPER